MRDHPSTIKPEMSGDISPRRRHAGVRSSRSSGRVPDRGYGGGELGGWEDPSKVELVASCGGSRVSKSIVVVGGGGGGGRVSQLEGRGVGGSKGFFRGKLPSKDFLKRVMPKLL